MKKITTILILMLLSISLIGCNNKEYDNFVKTINYDLFDYHYMVKNQLFKVEYDVLEELYDYDSISYYVENDNVVKVDYQGDIKGRDAGKSLVKATLFKGNLPVVNVALGYFIVIDFESESLVPIENYAKFQSLLKENRYGSFYLNSNITFPEDYDFKMIEKFEGILINPYGYVISGIKGSNAIFNNLNNAFIDGLIIRKSEFTGENAAAIAINSTESFINNTHVFSTTIQSSSKAAGLVVNSIDTTYESVSFEGTIQATDLAGGLIAEANNGLKDYSYYISKFMLNSYAYADITTLSETGIASGLVGSISLYGVIESGYFAGTLTGSNTNPISNNQRNDLIYYIYLYTTQSTSLIDKDSFAMCQLYKLTDNDILTGTVLPGLEAFEFNPGSVPKN